MVNDSEKMLLEILRMARELVINEYTDRRAQDHNDWLYESERMWKNHRMKLKYPVIPPYPTEKDIVERAQTLLKFLILGDSATNSTNVALPTELPKEEIVEESPQAVEEPIQVIEEPVQEIEEQVVESVPEEPTGRILPSVLKKLEKMRNKF